MDSYPRAGRPAGPAGPAAAGSGWGRQGLQGTVQWGAAAFSHPAEEGRRVRPASERPPPGPSPRARGGVGSSAIYCQLELVLGGGACGRRRRGAARHVADVEHYLGAPSGHGRHGRHGGGRQPRAKTGSPSTAPQHRGEALHFPECNGNGSGTKRRGSGGGGGGGPQYEQTAEYGANRTLNGGEEEGQGTT